MSFLKDNEHIIFMEMCTKYEEPQIRLPADDIKMLVDAGVKTCMSFGTQWDWMEPQKGVYDWSYYDDRIKLLTDLGMKVIFQAHTYFPGWLPIDWCLKNKDGKYDKVISPWNEEAWEYTKNHYRMVRDRYSSDNVLVMSSWLTDSETLFPLSLSLFDDHAKEHYKSLYGEYPSETNAELLAFFLDGLKKIFCDLQGIMSENQYKEIWTCMHPAIPWGLPSTANAIEEILGLFHSQYPDITINHLYCTWCQWQHLFPIINRWGQQFGHVFGGAEYDTGIVRNTELAKANNVRGLLYGPCHPHTGRPRIEPIMLQKAQESMALWG